MSTTKPSLTLSYAWPVSLVEHQLHFSQNFDQTESSLVVAQVAMSPISFLRCFKTPQRSHGGRVSYAPEFCESGRIEAPWLKNALGLKFVRFQFNFAY